MAQRADGGQGIPVRVALHAGGHPALLLDRFRRPRRTAAGCRQHQHRRMVRTRRPAAFGEGLSHRHSLMCSCTSGNDGWFKAKDRQTRAADASLIACQTFIAVGGVWSVLMPSSLSASIPLLAMRGGPPMAPD